MALPHDLTRDLKVGLKEWATVCSALGEGRQIILLRKGGIYESGGEFEIEHRQFLLFPTYLHQNAEMLKDPHRAGLARASAEPEKIQISLAGEITDIAAMQSVLVRMPVKKIRRDTDKAVAGETLGEVASVLHQAIALVHQHDGRNFFAAPAGRHGEKPRQAAGAVNSFCDDFRHASLPKDLQRMP